MEDTDFCHVPRVEPQGDRFPNVWRERCRDVAEALEVNSVGPDLARLARSPGNPPMADLLQNRSFAQRPSGARCQSTFPINPIAGSFASRSALLPGRRDGKSI